jgi:Uma2 family endonuclease
MSEAARKLTYTWNDYRHWDDDRRWELIDGEAYAMSPAPSPRHQGILNRLARFWDEYLDNKPCRVLPAPVDVRLTDEDVVQPDLVVVCESDKITRTHIEGAPTLVVEILSDSTALYDRNRKLRLYARSGIKEVWLVTPYPWLVEVFLLDGASYRLAGTYTKTDRLQSPTFPDLCMDLEKIFDFPIEPGEEIQMVKEGHPECAVKKKRKVR